jgi:hypothetical protein
MVMFIVTAIKTQNVTDVACATVFGQVKHSLLKPGFLSEENW